MFEFVILLKVYVYRLNKIHKLSTLVIDDLHEIFKLVIHSILGDILLQCLPSRIIEHLPNIKRYHILCLTIAILVQIIYSFAYARLVMELLGRQIFVMM